MKISYGRIREISKMNFQSFYVFVYLKHSTLVDETKPDLFVIFNKSLKVFGLNLCCGKFQGI